MWRGSTPRPRRVLCSTWPQGRWPPRRAGRSPTMRGPSPCSTWPSTTASSRRSRRSTHYNFWRPETAIRAGDTDGNAKNRPRHRPSRRSSPRRVSRAIRRTTRAGATARPRCSRRIYGAGGHDITLTNPAVPGVTLRLHHVQADHGRYRRRARLRRDPFPIRPGGRRPSGTRGRDLHLQAQPAPSDREPMIEVTARLGRPNTKGTCSAFYTTVAAI